MVQTPSLAFDQDLRLLIKPTGLPCRTEIPKKTGRAHPLAALPHRLTVLGGLQIGLGPSYPRRRAAKERCGIENCAGRGGLESKLIQKRSEKILSSLIEIPENSNTLEL